ncbi:O-antigen ligase family protein [Myroides fluvii]|uniref:O-antigen ligase family protein n=1 Tax=Myroides fluvii TaxID=2572594 RepID=UPI00131AED7B|nr:O-antigen ligase family protein [Myroides fluvii]
MKEKIRMAIGNTLLFTYIAFLVFGFKIVNLALVGVLVFFLSTFKYNKAQVSHHLNENKKIYIVLLALISFQFIHGMFFQDLHEKRFGLLPLLFGSAIVLLWVADIRKILYIYLTCLVLLVGKGGYNILTYYLTTDYFTINSGGHIDAMLVVARPYLGFMLNIGILLCIYLYQIQKKYRVYYLFLSVFFFAYLVFIGNRMQVVSLLLLALLYFVFYMKANGSKKILSLLVLGISVFLLFTYTSTLKERFEMDSFTSLDHLFSRLEKKEPRVLIWKCAWSFTQESSFQPLYGLGKVETIDRQLAACYEDKTKDNPMRGYFLDALFNTHNQFLEYYVLTGIGGISLLLLFFGLLVAKVKRYFIPMALLLSLFNFCLVENLFNRQLGVYLFGFVLTLILFIYSENKKVKSIA